MRADPADDDPDEDAGGEGAGQPNEVHLAGVDAGGEVHHLEDLADVDAQETGEQPGRPPGDQERGRTRGFGTRDGEAVGPEFLHALEGQPEVDEGNEVGAGVEAGFERQAEDALGAGVHVGAVGPDDQADARDREGDQPRDARRQHQLVAGLAFLLGEGAVREQLPLQQGRDHAGQGRDAGEDQEDPRHRGIGPDVRVGVGLELRQRRGHAPNLP